MNDDENAKLFRSLQHIATKTALLEAIRNLPDDIAGVLTVSSDSQMQRYVMFTGATHDTNRLGLLQFANALLMQMMMAATSGPPRG